jgi:hypothetical protein
MIAVVLDAETIGVFISKTGMDRGVTEWIIAFSSRGGRQKTVSTVDLGPLILCVQCFTTLSAVLSCSAWHWLCCEEK